MRKTTFTILFCLVALLANELKAIAYNAVVAKDGSGNYTTVQAAFNAVPANSSSRYVIYIKNGTYKEMLNLASNKINVTIIGESKSGVVLTYDNYASKINPVTGAAYGTSGSSSTYIHGSGFYALNITFQNSAGPVGQALAIYVDGDRAVFKNCNFLGNQDTFYGGASRQYFAGCYFEGTTDFIFGPSIAVFETCKLHSKGGTALTAASTESYVPYGYVFLGCTIDGNSGVVTDLGRPWRPYTSVAYLNCSMTSVISAAGWDDWGNTANDATARFGEYNNTGAGSTISSRPAWIHRITSSEAANYTIANVLKGTNVNPQVIDNWNPLNVINQTVAAATLTKHGAGSSSQTVTIGSPIASFYYTWANATGVTVSGLPSGISSVINTSAQTVTITGTPSVTGTFNFTITTVGGSPNCSKGGAITVSALKSAYGSGNTKIGESLSFESIYPNPSFGITTLTFSLPQGADVDISLYDMEGRLLATITKGFYGVGMSKVTFNAGGFKSGLYLCKLTFNGQSLIKRLVIH